MKLAVGLGLGLNYEPGQCIHGPAARERAARERALQCACVSLGAPLLGNYWPPQRLATFSKLRAPPPNERKTRAAGAVMGAHHQLTANRSNRRKTRGTPVVVRAMISPKSRRLAGR